ncbi:MAG: hypothetical protein HY815_09120 [Candidatus Riflebacteria bacterium]|nr:hypothetical protein [Candidatus Riflebacteria bacterium]
MAKRAGSLGVWIIGAVVLAAIVAVFLLFFSGASRREPAPAPAPQTGAGRLPASPGEPAAGPATEDRTGKAGTAGAAADLGDPGTKAPIPISGGEGRK